MLEDLEARWRDERTPQAGIRLAEALRRQGDRTRAEGILTAVEGRLESDPRDLASRVALGGMRLALAQPDSAARVLEQVVQADPTHLKANKLLVEVYVELGQRDRARDRLDLYRLLNEGDPEIESLDGLVAGVGVAVPQSSPAVVASARGRKLRLAGGDPFAALTATATPVADSGSLLDLLSPATPPAASATLGTLYQEQGHREDAERVFREVLTHEPDNLQAREGLATLVDEAQEAPDAAAAMPWDADDADRQRRIGILRDYLARIQRGRGVMFQ